MFTPIEVRSRKSAALAGIRERFDGIPLKIINDLGHAKPILALRLGQDGIEHLATDDIA